jgi:hypothetical protein
LIGGQVRPTDDISANRGAASKFDFERNQSRGPGLTYIAPPDHAIRRRTMDTPELPSLERHEEFKDIVHQGYKEAEKECPLCKQGYPEEAKYCVTDGTNLERLADRPSPKPRIGRDADSGARMVSGHAEEG